MMDEFTQRLIRNGAMHPPVAQPPQVQVMQVPVQWEDGSPAYHEPGNADAVLKMTMPVGAPLPVVGDVLVLTQLDGPVVVTSRGWDLTTLNGGLALRVRRMLVDG